jgi:hypothetical protein
MWLITDIVTSLRILLEPDVIKVGTVLERFYFTNIGSKIFFLVIIGIALSVDYKLILGAFFVPFFWLLHAYLNVGKVFLESEYIIIPATLLILLSLRKYLMGLPTDSAASVLIGKKY